MRNLCEREDATDASELDDVVEFSLWDEGKVFVYRRGCYRCTSVRVWEGAGRSWQSWRDPVSLEQILDVVLGVGAE